MLSSITSAPNRRSRWRSVTVTRRSLPSATWQLLSVLQRKCTAQLALKHMIFHGPDGGSLGAKMKFEMLFPGQKALSCGGLNTRCCQSRFFCRGMHTSVQESERVAQVRYTCMRENPQLHSTPRPPRPAPAASAHGKVFSSHSLVYPELELAFRYSQFL